MAPEQLAGHEADARSDIFAFGAIVYEIATGRRAFEGTTAGTVIGAVLHTDPPPLSSLQPLVPPALDRIVGRCLAKDPDNRWQTARDLLLELKWMAEHGAAAVGIAQAARAKGCGDDGMLVVLALAVVVFARAYLGRGAPVESPRRSLHILAAARTAARRSQVWRTGHRLARWTSIGLCGNRTRREAASMGSPA